MPADHPYPELQHAASGWPYQPDRTLLRGHTILVTGAGDGIGSCAARTFAWYGADLVLLGRTQAKLEQVFDWISANTTTDPVIVSCDLEVADRTAFDELAAQILDHYGKLDGNPGATRTRMRAAAYPGENPGTLATPEQRMAAYLYFMGPEGQALPAAAQLDARDFATGAQAVGNSG